jgi:hypothetical protein
MSDLARLKRQMERNKGRGFDGAYKRYLGFLTIGYPAEKAWDLANRAEAIADAIGGLWLGNCGTLSPLEPGPAHLCQLPYGHTGPHGHGDTFWSER